MKFHTTDNTFGNGFYRPSFLYANWQPDYFHTKYVQDSLLGRQILKEPKTKFKDEDVSYIDNTPLSEILPEKSKSLKTLVEAINKEIDDRSEIREGIFAKTDEWILKCDNYLLEIKDLDPRYDSVNVSRRRSALEHEIFGLENEKRMEEVNCWRDLVFLKKDLFETLKEYWAVKNREILLSEETEEVLQYGS